jgi:hypothetical protein
MTAGGVAMIVFTTGVTGATTVEITGVTGATTVDTTGAIGAVTVEMTGATGAVTVEITGATGAVTVETTDVIGVAAEVTGAEDTVVDPVERDPIAPLGDPAVTIEALVNVVKACIKRTSTFKA